MSLAAEVSSAGGWQLFWWFNTLCGVWVPVWYCVPLNGNACMKVPKNDLGTW